MIVIFYCRKVTIYYLYNNNFLKKTAFIPIFMTKNHRLSIFIHKN